MQAGAYMEIWNSLRMDAWGILGVGVGVSLVY